MVDAPSATSSLAVGATPAVITSRAGPGRPSTSAMTRSWPMRTPVKPPRV
jgi:hypothetical protein